MSRHGYTDDDGDACEQEDCGECGACNWRERVADALASNQGQGFLREMVAAVEQEPGLCSRALLTTEGEVCAIGAVLRQRGEKVEPEDPDDYSDWAPDEIALLAGIPEEMAQEVMYQNDEWSGSPADVRTHMLAWARVKIKDGTDPSTTPEGRA